MVADRRRHRGRPSNIDHVAEFLDHRGLIELAVSQQFLDVVGDFAWSRRQAEAEIAKLLVAGIGRHLGNRGGPLRILIDGHRARRRRERERRGGRGSGLSLGCNLPASALNLLTQYSNDKARHPNVG